MPKSNATSPPSPHGVPMLKPTEPSQPTHRNLATLLDDELARLSPRYARVSLDHAALAPYPTLASLVDRLASRERNKSRAAQRERSELLAAVIGAFRPTHDRLLGAILVAAFRPMLATRRFFGADRDEREAIFFAALTEVVGTLDVQESPDQVHAILWRSAKKALVRKLRQHSAWNEVGFGDDADATPDRASWLPEPLIAAWLLSRGGGDRPDLDLALRVHERGSLKAYVDAEHATSPPAERLRTYRTLQKRHRRAIAELRQTLGGEPMPNDPNQDQDRP